MYGDLTNQWGSFNMKRHVGGNGNLIINFASSTVHEGSFTVNLIDEISKYLYSENSYFHVCTHFEISSNFPEIFPYFSSKTFDTSTVARKAICWLRNKGRMVFQQKCLMQLW